MFRWLGRLEYFFVDVTKQMNFCHLLFRNLENLESNCIHCVPSSNGFSYFAHLFQVHGNDVWFQLCHIAKVDAKATILGTSFQAARSGVQYFAAPEKIVGILSRSRVRSPEPSKICCCKFGIDIFLLYQSVFSLWMSSRSSWYFSSEKNWLRWE